MATANLQALPLVPKVKAGEHVQASVIGNFRTVTVEKVDPAIGRVFVAYEFALLAASRQTVEADAEGGGRAATSAATAMSNVSLHLAGAQLGALSGPFHGVDAAKFLDRDGYAPRE